MYPIEIYDVLRDACHWLYYVILWAKAVPVHFVAHPFWFLNMKRNGAYHIFGARLNFVALFGVFCCVVWYRWWMLHRTLIHCMYWSLVLHPLWLNFELESHGQLHLCLVCHLHQWRLCVLELLVPYTVWHSSHEFLYSFQTSSSTESNADAAFWARSPYNSSPIRIYGPGESSCRSRFYIFFVLLPWLYLLLPAWALRFPDVSGFNVTIERLSEIWSSSG